MLHINKMKKKIYIYMYFIYNGTQFIKFGVGGSNNPLKLMRMHSPSFLGSSCLLLLQDYSVI